MSNVNSMWPSDFIWWHRSASTFSKAMVLAWRLGAITWTNVDISWMDSVTYTWEKIPRKNACVAYLILFEIQKFGKCLNFVLWHGLVNIWSNVKIDTWPNFFYYRRFAFWMMTHRNNLSNNISGCCQNCNLKLWSTIFKIVPFNIVFGVVAVSIV